jgi:hypothetical protein
MSIPEFDIEIPLTNGPDNSAEDRAPQRSSSEEKDTMTPQQTRRKAQNRAA